jgi:hypothetical protein
MSEVVVLKGSGQYRALQYFADCLMQALDNKGISVQMINLNKQITKKDLEFISKEDPELCIGFNAMKITYNGEPYYSYLNCKHLAILVDHPAVHLSDLNLEADNLFISCVSQDGVDYLKKEFQFFNSFLLYHGVDSDIDFQLDDKLYDISFLGTLRDYKKQRKEWRKKYTENIVTLLEAGIQIGEDKLLTPIGDILNLALQSFGIELTPQEKFDVHKVLIPELDKYFRNYYRYKFFNRLKI